MVASKKSKSGSEKQFPGKLHDMMQFVQDNGLESIISWELNGYGIKINNPDRLVEILPIFFGQTKYRSFRRQLNMWHFHRILEGPSKDVFVHPYFVKHDKAMCAQMSRQMSFKPIVQQEQEYIALASCIEPDPINEISYLDTKVTHKSSQHQNLDDDSGKNNLFVVRDLAGGTSIRDDTVTSSLYPSKENSNSFQATNFITCLSNFDHLPALPSSLPDDATNSLDAALETIGSLIASDQQYNIPSTTSNNIISSSESSLWQDFNDGDVATFEGKSFFFLDDVTP